MDHTYRVTEIVGSSSESIERAIRNAVARAPPTPRGGRGGAGPRARAGGPRRSPHPLGGGPARGRERGGGGSGGGGGGGPRGGPRRRPRTGAGPRGPRRYCTRGGRCTNR